MYHYAKAVLPEASGYLPNDGPASRDLVVFAADRSALRVVGATLRRMADDIDKYLNTDPED